MYFCENGTLLLIFNLVAFPFVMGLLYVVSKHWGGVRECYGLNRVDVKTLIKWSALMLVVALIQNLIEVDSARTPNVFVQIYKTTYPTWLFWFYICAIVPFQEELLFRGLIVKMLQAINLKFISTNILTAIVFTCGHLYYSAPEIFYVFLTGLLFGYARFKTNSILTAMAMHVVFNVVGLIFLSVKLSGTIVVF